MVSGLCGEQLQSTRAAAPALPQRGRKPVNPVSIISGTPEMAISIPEPNSTAARKNIKKDARPVFSINACPSKGMGETFESTSRQSVASALEKRYRQAKSLHANTVPDDPYNL